MAVKFETVKAGDVLLDVHSERIGNTTARALGVWEVRVVSVDADGRSAVVRWNGNPAQTWHRGRVEKLRRFAPEWMRERFTVRSERTFRCYHCRATAPEANSAHHEPNCPHPKAVAYRKRAAKAAAR